MSTWDDRLESACRKHGVSVVERDVLQAFEYMCGGTSRSIVYHHGLSAEINRPFEPVRKAVNRLLADGYVVEVTKSLRHAVLESAGQTWGPLYCLGSVGELNATELGMRTIWAIANELQVDCYSERCYVTAASVCNELSWGLVVARTIEEMREGLHRRFDRLVCYAVRYESPPSPVPAWRDFWWRPSQSGVLSCFSLQTV